MGETAWPELNDETRDVWDANAAFWDERMGEGNVFHRELVGPAAERLLAIRPGERVLEIACGNGQFSRRLAELGADVLATDIAPGMIAAAQYRTAQRPELNEHVRFALLDATDPGQLAGLAGPFDAAVANMALMDMAAIDPLLRGLRALLTPAGRFVFTVSHPCFNQPGTRLAIEEEDRDGDLVVTPSVRVVTYKGTGARKGLAMEGQPRAQWYFTRTLADLFGACFAAGFVVDGLEEPAFAPGTEPSRFFGWQRYHEVPPVLAVRLRPNLLSGGAAT